MIASDLWQQLEFASEFEPDLQDTAVDWQRKWLGDFNAGIFLASLILMLLIRKWMNAGTVCFFYIGLGLFYFSITKTSSRKIEALICSMKFISSEDAYYIYNFTIRLCMEYCCHLGAGAPSCYLGMFNKPQKQVRRTIRPSIGAFLEPLAFCWIIVSLSLFYKYYLVDVHLNWLNKCQFLILIGDPHTNLNYNFLLIVLIFGPLHLCEYIEEFNEFDIIGNSLSSGILQ